MWKRDKRETTKKNEGKLLARRQGSSSSTSASTFPSRRHRLHRRAHPRPVAEHRQLVHQRLLPPSGRQRPRREREGRAPRGGRARRCLSSEWLPQKLQLRVNRRRSSSCSSSSSSCGFARRRRRRRCCCCCCRCSERDRRGGAVGFLSGLQRVKARQGLLGGASRGGARFSGGGSRRRLALRPPSSVDAVARSRLRGQQQSPQIGQVSIKLPVKGSGQQQRRRRRRRRLPLAPIGQRRRFDLL